MNTPKEEPHESTDPVFLVDSLSKTYGLTKALGITGKVKIPRGKFTCILGHSGSGKSTLLNLLALLEDADEDRGIQYLPAGNPAIDYESVSDSRKSNIRNSHFSVAFQDGHLIGHISSLENIELGMSLAGVRKANARSTAKKLTGELKLNHRDQARPQQLSGGEYQRVAIARSLAHGPEVVFADEPTGNLDTDTADRVMRILGSWKDQSKDHSLILVTHDVKLASRYGEHFLLLENGDLKVALSERELAEEGKMKYPQRYREDPILAKDQALTDYLEHAPSTVAESQLELYHKFNEESGSIVKDQLGRHDGEQTGATIIKGYEGNALAFEGHGKVNLSLDEEDAGKLTGYESCSFTLWFLAQKPPKIKQTILHRSGVVAIHLEQDLRVSAKVTTTDGVQRKIISDGPLDIGKWTHLAVVADGKDLLLYVNGSPQIETFSYVDRVGPKESRAPFLIGNSQDDNEAASPLSDGNAVDEFRIYSSGLSTAEIRQLSDRSEDVHFVQCKHQRNGFRALLFLAYYALRDLFPIKLLPFSWPIFLYSLKNTVFSVLTVLSIAVLVAVLLLGFGIFNGIQNYQEKVMRHDIRANRLLANLDTNSKVDHLDEEIKKTITAELNEVRVPESPLDNLTPWKKSLAGEKAVTTVHLSAQAQIFVHKEVGGTVGALGTTVNPDSPLLEKLRFNGKPLAGNPIPDPEAEGLIVSAKWLRSALNFDGNEFPDSVDVEYGRMGGVAGSSKENLPILAVVDELPDGSFLTAPGFWHKFRDGLWRPGYKRAEFVFEGNETSVKSLVDKANELFADRPALGLDCYTDSTPSDGKWRVRVGSSRPRQEKYWREVILKNVVRPFLAEEGINPEGKDFFRLKGEDRNPNPSPLDYERLVVYLSDLSAVSEVAEKLRTGAAALAVDPYVENSYKSIHRTRMLSGLILAIVAICALFLCIANVFLMFYQNVLRKRHEIGILKAFGSTKARISAIFSFEALYLCLGGCAVGYLFAGILGKQASDTLLRIFELKHENLYLLDGTAVFLLISFIFALCLSISFLATFKTAGQSANSLLRNQG